jgi:hypothetical protein
MLVEEISPVLLSPVKQNNLNRLMVNRLKCRIPVNWLTAPYNALVNG